jgi:hypothetical protein
MQKSTSAYSYLYYHSQFSIGQNIKGKNNWHQYKESILMQISWLINLKVWFQMPEGYFQKKNSQDNHTSYSIWLCNQELAVSTLKKQRLYPHLHLVFLNHDVNVSNKKKAYMRLWLM